MDELISRLKSRRLGILSLLKMVPDELWDWKPNVSMRSTAELASHLACGPLALLKLLKGAIPNEKSYFALEKDHRPKNAGEAVQLYEAGLQRLIAYLKEHIGDARENQIELFYLQHPTSIYAEVFGEIGHEWFHLGQLFTHLRQNSVSVDMGAYYGYKDPDSNRPPNK
ncbi:MAG: DinB family protein [Candidatus Heimdallarchaeota archaeon]